MRVRGEIEERYVEKKVKKTHSQTNRQPRSPTGTEQENAKGSK